MDTSDKFIMCNLYKGPAEAGKKQGQDLTDFLSSDHNASALVGRSYVHI